MPASVIIVDILLMIMIMVNLLLAVSYFVNDKLKLAWIKISTGIILIIVFAVFNKIAAAALV